MLQTFLVALRATLFTFVVTGLLYPLGATAAAQLVFPNKASGSVLWEGGAAVGSELIGQPFSNPAYLQPRPSAAGSGYDGVASSGSNLGPTSAKLRERVVADIARLQSENPEAPLPIPDELVTTSASGLDPHLSPVGAQWQVARIARARGVAPERVRGAIEAHIQERDLGALGEPRVNVLMVNLALDRQFGKPARHEPPSPQP